MSPSIAERAAVVAVARRWVGTPYHEQGDILGAGVDCGMILIRVFAGLGLIEDFDPRPYPRDWMMHRDDERYLDLVRRFARREYDPATETPPPGDVVVWKHGRTFSHGAIVTGDPHAREPAGTVRSREPGSPSGWPWVVHAFADAGCVVEEDVSRSPQLMRLGGAARPMRAFSVWGAD